jgi:hypothetical protein
MRLKLAVQNAVTPPAPRIIVWLDGKYMFDTGMMTIDDAKGYISQLNKIAEELSMIVQLHVKK